jgi:hypothetical protein
MKIIFRRVPRESHSFLGVGLFLANSSVKMNLLHSLHNTRLLQVCLTSQPSRSFASFPSSSLNLLRTTRSLHSQTPFITKRFFALKTPKNEKHNQNEPQYNFTPISDLPPVIQPNQKRPGLLLIGVISIAAVIGVEVLSYAVNNNISTFDELISSFEPQKEEPRKDTPELATKILALAPLNAKLVQSPTNIDLLFEKAFILQLHQQWHEALYYYNKALEVDPNCLEAHYNKGQTLLACGKKLLAKNSFREAIKINPKDSRAFSALGYVEATQCHYAEAAKYLDLAIMLDKNNPYALAYLQLAHDRERRGIY